MLDLSQKHLQSIEQRENPETPADPIFPLLALLVEGEGGVGQEGAEEEEGGRSDVEENVPEVVAPEELDGQFNRFQLENFVFRVVRQLIDEELALFSFENPVEFQDLQDYPLFSSPEYLLLLVKL